MLKKFENRLESSLDAQNSWVCWTYAHYHDSKPAIELAFAHKSKHSWEYVRLAIVCHCEIADSWRT